MNDKNLNSMTEKELKVRLKEYELTQMSAQHHNNNSYLYFSLGLTGIIVFYGLVIGNLSKLNPFLIRNIAVVGVLYSILLIINHFRVSSIIRHKYNVCKKIEEDCEMIGNHRGVRPFSININMMVITTISMLIIIYLWILLYVIYG